MSDRETHFGNIIIVSALSEYHEVIINATKRICLTTRPHPRRQLIIAKGDGRTAVHLVKPVDTVLLHGPIAARQLFK